MGSYSVTMGQNIYDVALHLYGSVEGVLDLMMCNPQLSLDEPLQAGLRLTFSDDYMLDEDVVAYFRNSGITPAGGERHVYPKHFDHPQFGELRLPPSKTTASFLASGVGVLEVDWGDNTPTQGIHLTPTVERYSHTFDSAVAGVRVLGLHGDAEFGVWDLTAAAPLEVYLWRPLVVEQLTLSGTLEVPFLALLRGTYSMNLRGIRCDDLRSLYECRELGVLDLRDAVLQPSRVDHYLMLLATRYGRRRSCRVFLPHSPQGDYREPTRDAAGFYAPRSGMEALWIITHEPAWNEASAWEFHLPKKTYTYEPNH